MKKGIKRLIIIFIMAALCMTGCGKQEKPTGEKQKHSEETNQEAEGSQGEDKITLVLAAFGGNSELSSQVDLFNQSSEDYRIEIKKYERSGLAEEDGLARLQREIMSGEGPDIIDFGAQYTASDIVGGYTENLLPYLEANDEKIEEKYFHNILEAFYYKEALYALPTCFTLQTFAGSSKELGDREHWNIREMMYCYAEKAQDMLLYPGQTKKDVLGTILTGSMAYYIDWEKGTCSFDGEQFQNVLAFANTFPENLEITDDFSVKQTFFEGGALLLPLQLNNIFDICHGEFIFGEEEITYIGFPMEGECGTVIKPAGPMLAISVNSRYKEASWEFISRFLEEEYQSELTDGFSLCRSVLAEKLSQAQEIQYTTDSEGNQIPVAKDKITFEGEEPVYIYSVTEEQADNLMELIEKASICVANDYQLYSLLWEEADSYFTGSKSLEETAKVMQSRASIYISERVK